MLAAVAAGKHVAADLAEAVARAGVRSSCKFQYRYNPAVQYLVKLQREEAFGELTHVGVLFLTDFGWSPEGPFAWRV